MTAKEAVIWLINISADIGKAEYRSLWHYEQALDEIRDLLESMPIEPEPSQVARDIATIIQNEKDMRVMARSDVIHCKDCKWWDDMQDGTGYGYCLDSKHSYFSANWEINIKRCQREDFYCADAERQEEWKEVDE